MKLDNNLKGISLVIISQFFFVVYFIFTKISFNYYNFMTTIVFWFGFSSIFSFLLIVVFKKFKHYNSFKKYWKYILLSCLLNTFSVITHFYALSIIGPSLTSFLSKMSIIFIFVMGIFLLNEKFNSKEFISSFIILFGVFLVSYANGEFILIGVVLMILNSFFISIARLIIKSKLSNIDSFHLVHYRATFVAIFAFIIAIVTNSFHPSISKGLIYATVPSIFTVVFGHLLIYQAYKYIEMSKTAVVSAFGPFLVLIVSYFLFGERFSFIQFFGGTIVVLGVIGLVVFREKHVVKKPKIELLT
jgi:drug/metabolite transporter (DMT)-like permease